MSIELKIKSKHLSVEAKIIRHEELSLKRQIAWAKNKSVNYDIKTAMWMSLNHHRRYDVRNENRATFLARAYIAEKPYASVEPFCKPENEYKFQSAVLPRVLAMVKKYSNSNLDMKHIQAWVDA